MLSTVIIVFGWLALTGSIAVLAAFHTIAHYDHFGRSHDRLLDCGYILWLLLWLLASKVFWLALLT